MATTYQSRGTLPGYRVLIDGRMVGTVRTADFRESWTARRNDGVFVGLASTRAGAAALLVKAAGR